MFNTYANLMALLVSIWSKPYPKHALLFRLVFMAALCFIILVNVHASLPVPPSPDPWP